MSGVFDLDGKGRRELEEQAALNPLDLSQPIAWNSWQGAGEAVGKGLLRPSAGAGRALLLTGAAFPVLYDKGRSLATGERTTAASDAYFRNAVEGLGNDAVDYWTPDANSMGSAARAVNTVSTVVGSIPQMIGTPAVFLANAGVDQPTELVRQGVDSDTALGVGAISLGVNALGFRLPAAFGSTLTTRLATGAGSNLALGVAADAATGATLESQGYSEQAAAYSALDPHARTLDTLLGLVFGAKAHIDAPRIPKSSRDALLAANNGDHFQRQTMPGEPASPAAAAQHQDALVTAIGQALRGEPVNVADAIRAEDFVLRPELNEPPSNPREFAQAGDLIGGQDYGAFLVALESGGVADARAPTSGAFGAHQFIPSTWRNIVKEAAPAWAEGLSDRELLALRSDPAKSAEMELVLRQQNASALEAAGQPVTPINLYAAHHFGPKRAAAFAAAPGDTPMTSLLTKGQIKANPYLAELTKAETIANWTRRGADAGIDVEADLPNFGLPEAPRTIADDDPLWEAVPGGETVNIDTPERQAMRESWVEEHFASAQPRQLDAGERPIAYVMGGGGASGKGTLLGQLQEAGEVPRSGPVHIDPDAIKTGGHGLSGIPEYTAMMKRGDGRAAAVVHEESSAVAKTVLARAIEGKFDLVLDRTLGDKAKGLAELEALKAAGYEVRLYGVTVDPKTAVQRAVKRAQRSGRYVPLNHLLRAHKGFASAFEDYAAIVDQARLYDNTGTGPARIAESQGKLTIADEAAYTSFRGREQINDQATTYRALQASPDRADGPGGREPDAGAVAAGDGRQEPAGARGGGPERMGAGDRGVGEAQRQPLDPQQFPAQGDTTTVVTERGLRLPVQYVVVDVSTLVTSHDNTLHVNPEFPAELQPRDRARAASEQQIARIENALNPELLAESPKAADGAPIVGVDKVVESGNARTIAVRRAYAVGKADDYRAFLVEEAARFGLDPAAVDGVAQPMLVRVTRADYNRAEFARQANESTVAQMSVTEQAQGDAARLPDMAALVSNEDGSINMRASSQFVREFLTAAVSPSEQGAMMTADGTLSQQGVTRIRNAVFAKAYGDVDLVAMMAESTDANVKNVLAGMLRAAPAVAKLREQIAEGGRYPMDITPDLTTAVRKFSQLRSEGTTVEQFLGQGDFFGGGLNGRAKDLLATVGEHARAPKRMAEFLQRWTEQVHALGDPRQGDLMGGQGADADAVVAKASADTEAANAPPKPSAGLFNAAGRPTAEATAPPIKPETRPAYEAAAAMPDLQIVDEAGNLRPAADFLAEAEAEAARAGTDAAALDTAVNCFLRSAA